MSIQKPVHFRAALFVIDKNWKQAKCYWIGECMNVLWFIHRLYEILPSYVKKETIFIQAPTKYDGLKGYI